MTYLEIIELAKGYSDRADAEVANQMDNFLRITESRVNRLLKTQKMSTRVTIDAIAGQEYYGLPSDFDALRDIEVQGADETVTPKYMSPEQVNSRSDTDNIGIAYTIIADQLQIHPAQSDSIIELVYYQTLSPLTSGVTTNWLSELYPDCYVFGLMVEINAFVKDPQTASIWDTRFKEAVLEIEFNDQLSRWSGTALQIRAE